MRDRRWIWALVCLAMGCGAEPGSTWTGLPVACPPVIDTAPAPVAAPAAEPVRKAPAKSKAKTTKPAATPSRKPAKPTKVAAPAAKSDQDPTDPGKPAADQAPAADGNALLAEVKATSFAMRSFEALLDSSEQRFDKSKPALTTTIKISYLNPGHYRFEMIKSTKSSNNGARLVFRQGDPKVTVKMGGLLGVVALTFPLSDSQVLTDNDYRIDQISLHGVLDRVTGPGYQAALAGTTTLGGDKITVLKVTSETNSLDPHIDYEYVGFDERKVYRLWTAFGKKEYGGDILHRIAISRVTPNADISPDVFKL